MPQLDEKLHNLGFAAGNAICYSGYREGQSPAAGIFPSYSQILEDLRILEPDWQYLRIYDAGPHALTLLEVIKREKLPFKVLMGMDLGAEENNPNCPWLPVYPEHELKQNVLNNDAELQRMIRLANDYNDLILGISIGNEASVDWTDHKVSLPRLLQFACTLRVHTSLPLTFCENYVPWTQGELDPLVEVLDFISVHTYPLWESIPVEEAIAFTQSNIEQVTQRFPHKPIIISEAGWATGANGRGFPASHASDQGQQEYCRDLVTWSQQRGILTFLFEAFDESWKGSDDPNEPEKHWGIYRVDRTAKPAVKTLF